MSLLDTIKRANKPGPPEHSIQLRVAAGAAVIISVVASFSQHELSAIVTVLVCASLIVGMIFSYRTRRAPTGIVKIFLAAFALGAFSWFFLTVTSHAQSGNIGSVEGPLAALFAWIQVGHAFDVPARRDLTFTLAGSATLMAVAAAQALTPSFGIFVILWLAAGLWGLFTIWSCMAGGSQLRPGSVAATLGTVVVIAFGTLLVLPAPHASSTILFPSSAAGDVSLGFGGGVTGDSGSQSQPAQAGTTNGATRVGGFLGFSNRLDTALRGTLSNQVIMRVRATVPSFWTAETFDRWNGTAWSVTDPLNRIVNGGSPFVVPIPDGDALVGTSDIQTFYLAATGPNLVFHAADAHQVWFPSQGLVVGRDGTIRTSLGMGPGTVYTVQSLVDQPTPAQLEQTATSDQSLDLADIERYTQLPYSYPRVEQLAKNVTAGKQTVYSKVEALISWIGAHTRYSTDIPPLPAGADAVNEFLFGNRVGYCEQISTALTVMLRTLGVPAREAVGYVPGSYDPITDLYDIQEKDAHAWVQVWFPYYGWQSFDPTAVVPLANPSPSRVLLHDVAVILQRAPWVPVGIPLAALVGAGYGIRAYRRRPATWAQKVARRLEHLGVRAKAPRRPGETLTELAGRLDATRGDPSGTLTAVAKVAEEAAYGRHEPPEDVRSQLDATLRTTRINRFRASARRTTADANGFEGAKGLDGATVDGTAARTRHGDVNLPADRAPDRTSPLR